MTDPHHGYDQPQLTEAGSVHDVARPGSQFPRRPSGFNGGYCESDYMPRGRFGPKEAGDTFAFSAMMAGPLAYVSLVLEQHAERMGATPEQAMGLAGSTFATSFLVTLGLKFASGFVRNYGESLIREIGAWLWLHVVIAAKKTVSDVIFPRRDREPEPSSPEVRPVSFPRLRRWLDSKNNSRGQ